MNKQKPAVIFCDNHILVAYKPAGMLTQPNHTSDPSLESFAKQWVKHKFNKPSNVFLHALHRIDRPVSGLVLFARTSKALSRLNELVRKKLIAREYRATVEGHLKQLEGCLEHYLIHAEHHAIVSNEKNRQAKLARLFYKVIETHTNCSTVHIILDTGRYHQIRAQFASIGHPILGDARYGSTSDDLGAIALECVKLSFEHPVTHQNLNFTI